SRDRALVVTVGVAERILGQGRVVELGFDDVGHEVKIAGILLRFPVPRCCVPALPRRTFGPFGRCAVLSLRYGEPAAPQPPVRTRIAPADRPPDRSRGVLDLRAGAVRGASAEPVGCP